MRTSVEWWNETKADPAKLIHWLQRQYVGELAAVNLLSELLVTYGSQAKPADWNDVHRIMQQEAVHGKWIKELLDVRGILPEDGAKMDRRYWAEVKPAVTSWAEGAAAGYHAENMRLDRIRAIANDPDAPADIRKVFQRILPHEEWHEEVFDRIRQGNTLTRHHEKGLEALNLLMV